MFRRLLRLAIVAALAATSLFAISGAKAATLPAHDPSRILVAFDAATTATERANVHAEIGGFRENTLLAGRVDVVRLPTRLTVTEAIALYRRSPGVSFAQPNQIVRAAATPNDPYVPPNGRFDGSRLKVAGATLFSEPANDAWNLSAVNAFAAWDSLAPAGAPWPTGQVTVGVIDSGIYAEHEDLVGKAVVPCATAIRGNGTFADGCADDNGHGTHVSGTIAAAANNGVGIAGVAYNARIAMCKALDFRNVGYSADFAACIEHLADRAPELGLRVISMSILSAPDPAMALAVDHAWSKGVLVVAAAGNEGADPNPQVRDRVNYPAGYERTVSVGATARDGSRWASSNKNTTVDIAAPGASVLSTVPVFGARTDDGGTDVSTPTLFGLAPVRSGYATLSGTSMATPHVAAAAALIAWRAPALSVEELRARLLAATVDRGAPGLDPEYGYGLLDLDKAISEPSL